MKSRSREWCVPLSGVTALDQAHSGAPGWIYPTLQKKKPAPTLRIAQRQSGLERVPRGYWFVRRIGLYPIGTVLPVRVTRLPVAMSRYELYFVGYV